MRTAFRLPKPPPATGRTHAKRPFFRVAKREARDEWSTPAASRASHAAAEERRAMEPLSAQLLARRGDAERFHLFVEIASLDAQDIRGSRDVAVLRRQRLQDVVALEALARVGERQRHAFRRRWLPNAVVPQKS